MVRRMRAYERQMRADGRPEARINSVYRGPHMGPLWVAVGLIWALGPVLPLGLAMHGDARIM